MDLLARGNKVQAVRTPNIVVQVTLDQPNVNFNFAALAEEKYGWDALHPLAARVRALNRYESDEESDSEAVGAEGNAEESTTHHGNADSTNDRPTDGEVSRATKKRRKRRKDLEYYDISDPFIDDDELILQERTAASKDGFFVFQGPLVAQGEKVRIEKADGTQKRMGGRGSRGGKGSRSRTAAVAAQRTPGPPRMSKSSGTCTRAESPLVAISPASPVVDRDVDMMDAPVDEAREMQRREETTQPQASEEAQSRPILATDKETESTNHAAKSPSVTAVSPMEAQGAESPKPKDAREPSRATPFRMKSPPSAFPVMKTPLQKVLPKKQFSAATLARRAARAKQKAAEKQAQETRLSEQPNDPGTPSTMARGSATPGSPGVLSDNSAKKPRKPPREKTAEEKAELARKARETRERKKLEKRAQEEAILARAIANPNIDTNGIHIPPTLRPSGTAPETPTPQDSNVTVEMLQVKSELGANQSDLAFPRMSPAERPVHADINRLNSPSGRSMSVEALLK